MSFCKKILGEAIKKLIVFTLAIFVVFATYAQTIDANGTLSFNEGTSTIKNSFYQDQRIKHIEFPASLKSIANSAFRYCVYIDDDLVLPNGLETVGASAFYNCINIHKITIPASVTNIGANAFSKNTSLVVTKNSYAHKWAMDNGYDYQFSTSGYPVGVTKVYKDFDVKTAWNQRGGYHQFAPGRERVLCGNLADATIVYYNGWYYQGSKSYASNENVFYSDFDSQRPNYDKIPRTFLNSYTDEEMYDADLLLWQQCMLDERNWGDSKVEKPYDYIELLKEHIPANIFTYKLKQKESETGEDYKTRKELEKILIDNCAHPFMAYAQQLGGGSNHGWVVDGLREKDGKLQMHCNFGWRGDCDGWYNVWDPIVNTKIDYQDPYRRFRFFVPFSPEELANWKPFVLSNEQKLAISSETHKVPYIENKTAYLPEGTTVVTKNAFKDNTNITAVKLPSTIRRINASSFQACTKLTELTIPASVEYINTSAFKGCTGLTKVLYNATNYSYGGGSSSAFNGCTNITQVIVGNGVKTIPAYIFRYCTKLNEVEIPASVKDIGTLAFPKTTKIICAVGSYAESWAKQNGYKVETSGSIVANNTTTNATTTNNVSTAQNASTTSTSTTNNSATTSANTTSNTSSTTTSTIQSIPDDVLIIPVGTTSIKTRAYANNKQIGGVLIPNTVKSIENYAFLACSNIRELTIPSSIKEIKMQSFKNCTGIKTIYYNATKASIAGEGTNSPFAGCTGLTKVVVKEGVEKIPPTIFLQCTSLKEIEIPSSVKEIHRNPFPKSTKVICPAGSYADTWARKNGYQVENR